MGSEEQEELKLLQEAFFIQEVGNEAVEKALEKNKKKKIASVFSKDGIIYYKLHTGVITQESPFK